MLSRYKPKAKTLIVYGLKYDVDDAEFIADIIPAGWYSLYKTKQGRYFITKNQTVSVGLDLIFRWDLLHGIKHDITPVFALEAIAFLEKHKMFNVIDSEFPNIENSQDGAKQTPKNLSQYKPKSKISIVNGLRYDVDDAELIADIIPAGWFTLYKTKQARYFITRNQTVSIGLDLIFRWDKLNGIKHDITPVTRLEAIALLEKHKMFDIIDSEFSDIEKA